LRDALDFRNRFRAGGHIYEVSCATGTPHHVGNYDAITNTPANTPWFDYMPARAHSYWRDIPTGVAEILIGGPVTVLVHHP
jgi:hypothetical protein